MKKVLFICILSMSHSLFGVNLIDEYKQCAGCHGEYGEKNALNRSKVINQMTKQEIIDALNGYKNNTYGGAMKGLMKVQVKKLTSSEIEQLAEFISKK